MMGPIPNMTTVYANIPNIGKQAKICNTLILGI